MDRRRLRRHLSPHTHFVWQNVIPHCWHAHSLCLGLFALEQQSEGGCVGACASAAFVCAPFTVSVHTVWTDIHPWMHEHLCVYKPRDTFLHFVFRFTVGVTWRFACLYWQNRSCAFKKVTLTDLLTYFTDGTQQQRWHQLGSLAGRQRHRLKELLKLFFISNSWVWLRYRNTAPSSALC